jgi:hypothetical protein
MAKRERERALQERRARKQQKKDERKQAAAERSANAESPLPAVSVDDPTPSE